MIGRVLAAVLAGAVVLAGCSSDATELVDANFTNVDVGDVAIRALVLVANEDGSRAAFGGALLNEGDGVDTLESVEVVPTEGEDRTPVRLSPDLELPPGRLIELGGPQDISIVLPPDGSPYPVGSFAAVTLRFAEAGAVTTRVLVADPANYLQPIAPGQ